MLSVRRRSLYTGLEWPIVGEKMPEADENEGIELGAARLRPTMSSPPNDFASEDSNGCADRKTGSSTVV